MKNIVFILPPDTGHPVGGFKIVYEYANRLFERGWQVSIGYDCRRVASNYRIWLPLKSVLIRILSEYRRWRNPRWFELSTAINKFCIYNERDIKPVDNLVATAVGTVDLVVKSYSHNKLYLIQGLESWGCWSEAEVKKTYCLGMKNITVSNWLKKIVDNATNTDDTTLILNGIDGKDFYLTIPLRDRMLRKVSMLYHKDECKGSRYGIKSLLKLKKIYPDLQAVLFGVVNRPKWLPSWIEYVQNATTDQLRQIYNESQIYLYPSIEEGFGLTCVESMACGCALCATSYRGVHEFAMAGENALLSPVKDVDAMVKNVCSLLDNDDLRYAIARKGLESVRKFDWDNSIEQFEKLLR